MRMRHIALCGLPRSTIFFHIISNGTIFGKKVTENKMWVLIFCSTFVWSIPISKKNWTRYDKNMYIGVRVEYPLFLADF